MLMTGGILGLIFYSVVLFGPAFFALRGVSFGAGSQPLILATILCMALYGLFFAVFRLIPFNLVLGGLWGIMLANMTEGKKV